MVRAAAAAQPALGQAATGSIQGGGDRLTDFDLGGLSFSVASGRVKLPCSTTPAADESGRPAPRSTRGKITSDTQQRWLAGARHFALSDDQGKLHVLSPAVKEQLHHMPAG